MVVAAGSAVGSAEHLAGYSVRRAAAEASFVVDADAVGIASLYVGPGDSSQQAAQVGWEIFQVSADQQWREGIRDSYR